MATTAELAGDNAPALITVGKDGAVFYWMYDPAPPGTDPKPQGYAQVPGKHRKRKASDMDSAQPATAAAGDKEADDSVVSDAAEDSDHSSSSRNSGSSSSSSGSEEEEEGDEIKEAPGCEGDAQASASASGRAMNGTQQQQQTKSFAGKQGKQMHSLRPDHHKCDLFRLSCCVDVY